MKKIGFILAIGCLFIACKKKDNSQSITPTPAPTPSAQPPAFFINIPADAHGVLMAFRVPYTFSNNYTTLKGDASAFFYTAPGDYNYLDAGIVKCNDSVLTKQSSGSYLFNSKAKNGQTISGIDYSAGSTWTISGTSSVSSFSYTNPTFPTDAILTSSTMLNKNQAYTATFNGVVNADSVVVMLGCDSVLQKKTVHSTSGSCHYTAAEVGAIKRAGSANKGYLNFISYKLNGNTVAGKKYYMINSNTTTYTLNIQ